MSPTTPSITPAHRVTLHATPRGLLRAVSIAEACTWALLLVAMLCKYVLAPRLGDYLVAFAGAAHGTAFIAYLFFGLVIAANSRWTLGTILLGGFASVPPFVTLLFDAWVERRGKLRDDWVAPAGVASPLPTADGAVDADGTGAQPENSLATASGLFGSKLDGLIAWTRRHPVTLSVTGVAAFLFIVTPSLAAALRG